MAADASSSSSNWRDDLHETMKKLKSLLTDTDTVFLKEDYNFDQESLVTFISFLESRSVNNVDESISKSGAKIQSLVNKSKDRPWDKEDLSGNTSDVFIHRKSTTNLSRGDSKTNKGQRYNILTDYAQVVPTSYQSGLGNILGLNRSQAEDTNKCIENLMSSLGFNGDAGVAGLTNPAPSSNFLNVTPNSSNFLQSNGTNTGYGVNANGHKYGTSGLVPPVNSNMYNNHNVTSRATYREHGVDGSTKKCLDKLRGPDGELPQKLRNIPPHLIENVCNEIMDLDVNVSWDDIGGLHHAKKCVNEMAIMPLLRPDIFKGCRSPGRGLLLFGPPGAGKTMIGKAIAGEAKATFFYISASSVTSKWVGESEHLVRALFGVVSCHQPAVIFVDEIDSLLSKRKEGEHECYRRMKTQFFIGMEGFNDGNDQILIIGATNKPQDLDDAARRRFTKRLYIPLPSPEARTWIVKNILEKDGLFKLSKTDIDSISKLTEGYSGSDMKNLVKDAAMGPVREALKQCPDITKLIKEDIRPVTLKDFEDSLQEVRPSVGLNQLGTYENWNDQFGSLSRSNNSTDGNTKKRKTVNNTSFEIHPSMNLQKPDKKDGQATNGDQTNHKVDVTNGETNTKYYKEKLEVLKGIYEALQAKNKIDEKKLQLKQKLLESRLEGDL